MLRLYTTLGLASLLFIEMPLAQASDSIHGTWLRPKTGAHIQSYNCNGGLGLKVIKSTRKEMEGVVIMCGARQSQQGRYEGSLRSVEDGKVYTGSISFSRKRLKLRGCITGSIFCRTERWQRLETKASSF